MIIITLILSMAMSLYLTSKKINMGFALMIGAGLLALLNGRSIFHVLQIFIKTLGEYTTFSLTATIVLMFLLSHLMSEYLILDRMIVALEKMMRSAKATILLAPAIMGTLLVTGGAMLSCPVVGTLGEKLHISNDKKASINMMFRHALYFIFPLSPTFILSAQLGDYKAWDIIKLQFPIGLVLYVLGYFIFLRKLSEPRIENTDTNASSYTASILQFMYYSSPIITSLVGVALLNIPFYISLFFGIITSIGIHIFDKEKVVPVQKPSLLKTIYRGIKPSMIIVVIGIMIFKNVVNDMAEIFNYLNGLLDLGIPLELLIFVACAVITFPMASMQPCIAIMFPMVLPLAPDYHTKLLYAMFIYTSSFIFYYISPLHLCQVLTLEYFQVKIKDLYKNYVYILPITYVTMIALYYIYK